MATDWTAAHEAAKGKIMAAQINPTITLLYELQNFAKLCKKIEKAYPDLAPDMKAVENGGVGRNGEPIKLAVYARPKSGDTKAGNVTLYGSGKAVWTNLDPVGL